MTQKEFSKLKRGDVVIYDFGVSSPDVTLAVVVRTYKRKFGRFIEIAFIPPKSDKVEFECLYLYNNAKYDMHNFIVLTSLNLFEYGKR